MKSKGCERVMAIYNKKPWYVKLQIWFAVEMQVVSSLGWEKYLANKLK